MSTSAAATGRSFLRRTLATTPGRYRALAALCLAALLVTLAATTASARSLQRSTDRVRTQSGPVLIATQQVFSSLAEADAAATAEHLAGKGDGRDQRRLYEDALERAARQIDVIASRIGDDETAHDALADLLVALNRYAGAVETAREKKGAGAPDADAALAAALAVSSSTITPAVATLLDATNGRIDRDTDASTFTVLGLLAVAALVLAQIVIARRTNRLVNIPLAVATVIVVATLGWLFVAAQRQHDDVRAARSVGVDSIGLTGTIQATAYRAKAAESLALLGGGSSDARFADATKNADAIHTGTVDAAAVQQARSGAPLAGRGLLTDAARVADSARERASVAEMLERWRRYRVTSDTIRRNASNPTGLAEARTVATNEGNSTFNGFNLAVETFLADNRGQFEAHLDAASDRLRLLDLGMVVLPLLAAALALWGIQIRWNEYR
jgi:hypothetical protein